MEESIKDTGLGFIADDEYDDHDVEYDDVYEYDDGYDDEHIRMLFIFMKKLFWWCVKIAIKMMVMMGPKVWFLLRLSALLFTRYFLYFLAEHCYESTSNKELRQYDELQSDDAILKGIAKQVKSSLDEEENEEFKKMEDKSIGEELEFENTGHRFDNDKELEQCETGAEDANWKELDDDIWKEIAKQVEEKEIDDQEEVEEFRKLEYIQEVTHSKIEYKMLEAMYEEKMKERDGKETELRRQLEEAHATRAGLENALLENAKVFFYLQQERSDLLARLSAAFSSAQLYRELLHDLD